MKTKVLMLCLLLIAASASSFAREKAGKSAKQVLIVGLPDNVKSNYFYKGMIAEETGMQADSIVQTYNNIIARNIAAACKENSARFIPAQSTAVSGQILNEIKVTGEEETSYADLSAVPTEVLQKELDANGADYLLVLNQHYLKWQEVPFRTLFHIVSYTLFDKDKNELYRGNHYFTSMDLENAAKMEKSSRKSSSKIASSILKSINAE